MNENHDTPPTMALEELVDTPSCPPLAKKELEDLKAENASLRGFESGWRQIEAALGRTDEERARQDLTHYVPGLKRECEGLTLKVEAAREDNFKLRALRHTGQYKATYGDGLVFLDEGSEIAHLVGEVARLRGLADKAIDDLESERGMSAMLERGRDEAQAESAEALRKEYMVERHDSSVELSKREAERDEARRVLAVWDKVVRMAPKRLGASRAEEVLEEIESLRARAEKAEAELAEAVEAIPLVMSTRKPAAALRMVVGLMEREEASRARAEELRGALEEVQWVWTRLPRGDWDVELCPRCGEDKRVGHAQDCTLRALLASPDPAPGEGDSGFTREQLLDGTLDAADIAHGLRTEVERLKGEVEKARGSLRVAHGDGATEHALASIRNALSLDSALRKAEAEVKQLQGDLADAESERDTKMRGWRDLADRLRESKSEASRLRGALGPCADSLEAVANLTFSCRKDLNSGIAYPPIAENTVTRWRSESDQARAALTGQAEPATHILTVTVPDPAPSGGEPPGEETEEEPEALRNLREYHDAHGGTDPEAPIVARLKTVRNILTAWSADRERASSAYRRGLEDAARACRLRSKESPKVVVRREARLCADAIDALTPQGEEAPRCE